MGSFLSMFYFIIYNCISYGILHLFLISIEIYFIFTKRLTILDYVSESLSGSLTSTLLIRFCYISDDGNLVQRRALIGIFNCRSSVMSHHVCNLTKNLFSMFEVLLLCWHYFEIALCFILKTLVPMFIIPQCHGDIEPSPGPRKLKTNNFSVCHWNLNSLSAHRFSKFTQLKAYNSIYKYDFICLSETYLDSSITDNLTDIEGYKLIWANLPDKIKRGGVCIY